MRSWSPFYGRLHESVAPVQVQGNAPEPLDESTAKLIADSEEILEALRGNAPKREEPSDLDEFAGRIAERVAESLNQQLAVMEW